MISSNIYIYIDACSRSIIPGGKTLLINEQRRLARNNWPLTRCTTEVCAAKHRLPKRIKLLALVDTTIGRRVRRLLLLLLLLRICYRQLDIPGWNSLFQVVWSVSFLQSAVFDTVIEVHDETYDRIDTIRLILSIDDKNCSSWKRKKRR